MCRHRPAGAALLAAWFSFQFVWSRKGTQASLSKSSNERHAKREWGWETNGIEWAFGSPLQRIDFRTTWRMSTSGTRSDDRYTRYERHYRRGTTTFLVTSWQGETPFPHEESRLVGG